jgi:hypothetical protein
MVAGEHQIDGPSGHLKGGIGKLPFRKNEGESGNVQQNVTLAQRDLELIREMQEHAATRLRTARFEKAQMSGRDFSFRRQIELTHTPALAPVAAF